MQKKGRHIAPPKWSQRILRLFLRNEYVEEIEGDLISQNLYSGTMGGPHLHFEIRFYRNSEVGNEDFYGSQNNGDNTTLSSGICSFGYWNPDIGYGYVNPKNFEIE